MKLYSQNMESGDSRKPDGIWQLRWALIFSVGHVPFSTTATSDHPHHTQVHLQDGPI